MKPISHPRISDITVEGILYALADPVRVQIYMSIAAAECPQKCANFSKVNNKDLPKSSLSQHFKILREAGLIKSVRKGVEMQNTTRCAELKEKFGNLIMSIIEAYRAQAK